MSTVSCCPWCAGGLVRKADQAPRLAEEVGQEAVVAKSTTRLVHGLVLERRHEADDHFTGLERDDLLEPRHMVDQ